MKATLAALIATLTLVGACSTSRPDATATTPPATTPLSVIPAAVPPVPAAYASLAGELGRSLDRLAADVPARTRGAGTIMGAHLTVANGNRGPALLEPTTLPAVDRFLDRFQQLGVRGITLTVSFPLLVPTAPDSGRYLAFFENVAGRVRAHGMTLAVEQNAIFAGTVFSPVKPDYTGLTVDTYAREQHDMAQVIIDHLRPDYLSLLGEPDTFAHNLGLPALDDPATAAHTVAAELHGLRRHHTKVGAGTGTWSSPEFVRQLVEHTSIDFVALHLYPVSSQVIANMDAQVRIARDAHKPLVMDEAWLYKVGATERPGGQSNVAAAPDVFRRDVYSFWQPLDARFLDLLARYTRDRGFVYVSPFWTALFFGALDYGPATATLSYAQTASMASRVQYANVVAGRITHTGAAYEAIIRSRG
jgi:hypothetical protein